MSRKTQICFLSGLSARGVGEKCTLCGHRVDEGLEPACVIHCPGNALYFGDVNGFTENTRKKWTTKINKARISSYGQKIKCKK